MTFISLPFYIFLVSALLLYYLTPRHYRQYILLIASILFYAINVRSGFCFLLTMTSLSYFAARLIQAQQTALIWVRRLTLCISVLIIVAPLLYAKEGAMLLSLMAHNTPFTWLAPLGLSFYTLQIVGYLADVYQGKLCAERNFLKYTLFISFFPQIIQGPIPLYQQLSHQLWQGHLFDSKIFTKGLHFILWGFFLKLMIADKAAPVVNTIFTSFPLYGGQYILLGGVLYAAQLYTDFLACTYFARGIAQLFGIELINNFNHPYTATSIKDFWSRWHLSLSHWLRDYIYIPLGGNRKGKYRKYINLALTFLISGIWHGSGLQYLAWGLLHAGYQISGEMLSPTRKALYAKLSIAPNNLLHIIFQRTFTFLLVTYAWIIFRAENLQIGLKMIYSSFTVFNPWIFFDDSLFTLGLNGKEYIVLIVALLLFGKCAKIQQQGTSISTLILSQHIILRWSIYLIAIFNILIFGSYGAGFNASNFIYGGF